MPLDLDRAVATARRAAEAAARAALPFFRREIAVEKKPDRSPVTAADRAAERAILDEIRGNFPDHAILAEESGSHAGSSDARWIVDPLDGTRGFTRGGVFWGPLVALEAGGAIVAGAMALPALGAVYWAGRGRGAFRASGGGDGERLRLSRVDDLAEATVSLGELRHLLAPSRRAGVERLIDAASSTRCYGDLAACAMLLDGRADAWLEAGVQPWDLAPLGLLVEEAGGRVTNLDGKPSLAGGDALATNGLLHAPILALLQS